MDCENCKNESRIARLEEDSKKNSETHEKFYNNFEDLRTNDAVKDERDKNMFLMLQQIQKDVTELKGNPGKLWGIMTSAFIVGAVTIVINIFMK